MTVEQDNKVRKIHR